MHKLMAALVVMIVATLPRIRADEFEPRYQAIGQSQGKMPEATRLHQLFEVDWAYTMTSSPETATYVGYPGLDSRWTDESPPAIAERKQLAPRPLTILTTIDRSQLSPADQISYDLFKRQAEEKLEGARFPVELIAVTQLFGGRFLRNDDG